LEFFELNDVELVGREGGEPAKESIRVVGIGGTRSCKEKKNNRKLVS
jgi:hypothetical protein